MRHEGNIGKYGRQAGNKGKKRYEGIANIPLFYRTLNGKDITNAYNQAVIKASMSEPVQKSVFDKYI